jgi:hypothetical protein
MLNPIGVKNMRTENPRYVTKKAISSLIEKLNLPSPSEYEQDWEYVVSNPERIDEFIDFYKNNSLSDEEKFALMIIIISSYNDLLENEKNNKNQWDRINCYLLEDYDIHLNTILYWSVLEVDDIKECFSITPFMRKLLLDKQ